MKTFLYISLICIIIHIIHGCSQKAYEDENFQFDKQAEIFFREFIQNDTLIFENSIEKKDTFLITKIDSSIHKKTGVFINERAYKEIFISYKQVPINYWSESRIEKVDGKDEKITEDARLITITKFPDNNSTELYISFKNFRCLIKNMEKMISHDKISLQNINLNEYYKFTTSANSLLRESNDVECIIVTSKDGFLAYKEKGGGWGIKK